MNDREPQPSDGPDFHAEHAAWAARQSGQVDFDDGAVLRSIAASIRPAFPNAADLLLGIERMHWPREAHRLHADNTDLRRELVRLRAEVVGWEERFPCDGLCRDYAEEDCSRHGRKPAELWAFLGEVQAERDAERARRAKVEALAAHLVSEHLGGRLDSGCSLTADSGSGRCTRRAVAVKWEHGFADEVCETHAEKARARGALVVSPRRHDGTASALASVPEPSDALDELAEFSNEHGLIDDADS